MKNLIKIFMITGIIIALIQFADAVPTENDYGQVKAWFNGQEATVKNIKLKIGEPADIKVMVTSNISGNVYVKLTNPLVTEPYDVIDGTGIGKRSDNIGVLSGWSKNFTWTVTPNGAWKNGNAPINIFVEFSKIKDDKKIEFTIADPYILDEQYTGAPSNPTPQPATSGTPAKPAPFPSVLIAVVMLLAAWCWLKHY
ncbi:MAG: sarcinarray family MAST domain-containing protein [Candidatus Methanoperedens sp.]|nr:sarcinarray family MAST domain-containing protein [Candidatus Methanoperedens sp.]